MKKIVVIVLGLIIISCNSSNEKAKEIFAEVNKCTGEGYVQDRIVLYRSLIPNENKVNRINIWRVSSFFGPHALISVPIDEEDHIDYFEFDIIGDNDFGQFNSQHPNTKQRRLKISLESFDKSLFTSERDCKLSETEHNLTYRVTVRNNTEIVSEIELNADEFKSKRMANIVALLSRISALEHYNILHFIQKWDSPASADFIDSLRNLNGYIILDSEVVWMPNKK